MNSPFNVKAVTSPTFITNTSRTNFTTTSPTSPICNSSAERPSTAPPNFHSSVVIKGISTSVLLAPLKPPKSYGTYTKQQQDEVIAFIKDGNSLRTAEKVFGIPKSTMHCWLKKLQLADIVPTMADFTKIENNVQKIVRGKTNPQAKCTLLQQSTPEKARTQIIIEEAELIRFLQTGEGAELIAKSYNIPLVDFNNFIKQAKQQNKLKGLLVSGGEQKRVEVVGFVHDTDSNDKKVPIRTQSCGTSHISLDRKRNFSDSDTKLHSHHSPMRSYATEYPKKKKIENTPSNGRATISDLVALLTNRTADHADVSKTLVLTPEQLVTASKLIRSQPGIVNTYLATKPLVVQTGVNSYVQRKPLVVSNKNLMVPTDVTMKQELPKCEQAELSPTFPKIISPVSIKAERIDNMDCMTPLVAKLQESHLVSTVTSNKSAAMNLNEINRSQSEKELMALVDGENVSADELCADLQKSLDVNTWVDNEAWYTDQYLQYFQVSPTHSSSPDKSSDLSQLSSVSTIEEVDEDTSAAGITFTSAQDKENILSFLADGNSIEKAGQVFNIPQSTIRDWLPNNDNNDSSIDNEEKPVLATNHQRHTRFESAFYKPTKASSNQQYTSRKSAFSKAVSK